MKLPNRLKAGDTVGLIAPASPPNPANLEKGIAFIESLGLNVKTGKHSNDVYGYLAGTDADRLADLHAMFRDPHIAGIICICGGYGTGRIADKIDYQLIAANPKVFWGYSDITFLHTTFQQRSGLVTFHGPMVSSDIGEAGFASLSRKMFNQLFEPTKILYSEKISPLEAIAEGEAQGELTGGNLSLLCSTLGTPYEIDTEGKLLLIEDVDEEPYRIDGMLNQLRMAGKLEQAAGIVVGDFKNAVPKKRKSSLTLEQVLNGYLADLDAPVVKGFKIGHCQPHVAVPLGAEAHLSASKKTLVIEPGVR
ncbi:S66 peptidase family protein [Sediminibacillus halophilus]|uniref:Muramoyltetrapeptide carboxypeptidase n=1 Tax=Sediminibacillus halophilus TaxID=482461 RepID=A0A1G9U1I2_9BACI|nr:LD-carboxypeptidase [Sediminibacillus halophilus]SDM53796.1 muramoyltetrapeptide carboxypeptidase [Sediminibacillus halophilus]